MKVLGVVLVLVVVAAAVGGYVLYAPIGPAAGTSDEDAVYVDIAPGTGTQGIAAQLERAGVLRSRYAFYLLRGVKGGRLPAGEYRFNRPATAGEVYDRMVRGDVYTRSVTIPEGYNIFDIAGAVEAAGMAGRVDFLASEHSEAGLIADLSPHATSLEGYLFPDTYKFPRSATPVQMLGAMVKRFRQAAGQLGLTQEETARTVILASLVEKEVSQEAERPLVAGVFVNRLARNMPLATDPSVIYAALLEGRYRGTIYASDLQNASAYNTYRHVGLPPGPIANPGVAALKAAMTPAATDYLYFVADAAGHSKFSTTLKEHANHVQEYRRETGQAVAAPVKPAGKASTKKRPRR